MKRRWAVWMVACLGLVALAGCIPVSRANAHTERGEAHVSAATQRARRLTVVVLAIDGVRWQDVFYGVDRELAARFGLDPSEVVGAAALMPELHRLASSGGVLVGAPGSRGRVRASGPNFLSLPGYEEMLGGRPPACRDNQCARATRTTLVDEFAAEPGAGLGDVAVITSWPAIGRVAVTAPDRAVLSVGRTGGVHRELLRATPQTAHWLELGERAGNAPGNGDFRPDALTAALGMAYLAREPRFLFLGLGETDEYAHAGDYRKYLAALRAADRVLAQILATLDAFELSGGRTLLFVTTDHGRERLFCNHGRDFPESARVWFAAGGSEIRVRGTLPLERDLFLDDLAPTIRYLAGMPAGIDAAAGNVIAELVSPATESQTSTVSYAPR